MFGSLSSSYSYWYRFDLLDRFRTVIDSIVKRLMNETDGANSFRHWLDDFWRVGKNVRGIKGVIKWWKSQLTPFTKVLHQPLAIDWLDTDEGISFYNFFYSINSNTLFCSLLSLALKSLYFNFAPNVDHDTIAQAWKQDVIRHHHCIKLVTILLYQ